MRIRGICTNLPLLRRILADEVFRSGDYDTGYMEHFLGRIDLSQLSAETEEESGQARQQMDAAALRVAGSDELKVPAPSTGIFYITPSPAEPEYVSVGDVISVHQTLCQIEAMKLYTPLTLAGFNTGEAVLFDADRKYLVTRINQANGQQVNPGDLLFVVKPQD